MRKSLLITMTPAGVIGKHGRLPWPMTQLLQDRFRRLTVGLPMIMGRHTHQTLTDFTGQEPDPIQSRNVIVVSNTYHDSQSFELAPSLSKAIMVADRAKIDECIIIGGEAIFKEATSICDRIYLTIVNENLDGDTKLDLGPVLKNWIITERTVETDARFKYNHITLDKSIGAHSQFITFERLPHNNLPIPAYGTAKSAGFDLAACLTRCCKQQSRANKVDFWVAPHFVRSEHETWLTDDPDTLKLSIAPNETILIPTGFKCAFGANTVLQLYPRSGLGVKGLVLANGTGIIDEDYRGELLIALLNRSLENIVITHGDRIAQGVLTLFSYGIPVESKVDETARGTGGFGSTGK